MKPITQLLGIEMHLNYSSSDKRDEIISLFIYDFELELIRLNSWGCKTVKAKRITFATG